jgi:hypothetical protein
VKNIKTAQKHSFESRLIVTFHAEEPLLLQENRKVNNRIMDERSIVMKKTTILTVAAAIAILGLANTTFAFGGNRGGGGFRHQESRQEFRRDYHREFRRDFNRREIVVVRPPCREPVYVCPPRSGLIIGPFIIIGF